MKEFLRKIYYSILKILPAKLVINIENIFTYKRPLKKNKIEYFGEKIQWMKLHGNLQKYNNYVDKYLVRDYVKEKIGEEYLIPLLGVYEDVSEIDYSKLPKSFVLKANHGSGYNIIVKDKSKSNFSKINKKLSKWLKEDYYKIKKEYQYQNVKKKITCEKFIQDKNNQLLDYKFFCFDGKPAFVKVDFDRYENHKVNFYDMDWNLLEMQEAGWENYTEKYEKPENFDLMQELTNKLCEDFQFVRVDLYNADGKIYFGELTFTPASGKHAFVPLEKDIKIAKGIRIENE